MADNKFWNDVFAEIESMSDSEFLSFIKELDEVEDVPFYILDFAEEE